MSVAVAEACWLTAAGRSAVAVVAVRGPGIGEMMARLFQPAGAERLARPTRPRDVSRAQPGDVYFGHWRSTGEELVVCRTSRQWEVHCHGGVAAAPRVLGDLVTEGCQQVSAAAWELAPGASDSVNAALRLLARAATLRVASMLLDQSRGAWDRAAAEMAGLLSEGRWEEAGQRLERWERIAPCAKIFERPWRVAICGAPNAGKSTLLNALLGYERTVVWEQPGTTRDVVESCTVLDGWPVEIWDTAGIRETADPLEREGARRAQEAARRADLLIELVDLSDPQRTLLGDSDREILRVGNKLDLAAPDGSERLSEQWPLDLCISAASHEGVEKLGDELVRRLAPYPPAAGEPLPCLAADHQRLRDWRRQLDAATFGAKDVSDCQ